MKALDNWQFRKGGKKKEGSGKKEDINKGERMGGKGSYSDWGKWKGGGTYPNLV